MRIFYFSKSIFPSNIANSVQVIKTCEYLAANNSINLFGISSDIHNDLQETLSFYDVKNKFIINYIKNSSIRFFGNFIYAFRIMKKIKVDKLKLPDVFYGRHIISLLFAAKFELPIFLEIHSVPTNRIKTFVLKILLKKKCFKKLIVTSKNLKEFYLDLYPFLEEDNVVVIRNGASQTSIENVDNSIFENNLIIADSNHKVGYFGNLYSDKGIDILLELSKRLESVSFYIIGGDKDSVSKYKMKALSSGLNNLYFIGHVKKADLDYYYNKMDILIAPYTNVKLDNVLTNISVDKYASPLKILEYMSKEKPIIASDLPMIREVLTDKVNALLFDVNNIDDVISKINNLIGNSSLRNELKTNAKNLFINNYTWEARADKISKTIKDSL